MVDDVVSSGGVPERVVRSAGACLLPDIRECRSSAAGTVARLAVCAREPVREGQALLVLTLHPNPGSAEGPAVLVERAPVAGLVARWWVQPGAAVERGDRLLSIVHLEHVRVLALFAAGALPPASREARATVAVGAPVGRTFPGRVLGPGDALASRPGDTGPQRVVLELASLPPEALLSSPSPDVVVSLALDARRSPYPCRRSS